MARWLIILLLTGTSGAGAQSYEVDTDQSLVIFKIRHFGAIVEGVFPLLNGSIRFNSDSLKSSYFNISVDASRVDTNIGLRDKHLRNEDYFDVKTYPEMVFKSNKINRTNMAGTFIMTGDLVIKGTSREITFSFTIKNAGDEYEFVAKFNVHRKDFSVGGSQWLMDDEAEVNVRLLTSIIQ